MVIDNFFNNDVIVSPLLKKVINMDQNSRTQTAMCKLSTESVGSRRELVYATADRRRKRICFADFFLFFFVFFSVRQKYETTVLRNG